MNLNYLTEEEAKMPLKMALMQIVLGLQSCKNKECAVELLMDAVELGKTKERNKWKKKECEQKH